MRNYIIALLHFKLNYNVHSTIHTYVKLSLDVLIITSMSSEVTMVTFKGLCNWCLRVWCYTAPLLKLLRISVHFLSHSLDFQGTTKWLVAIWVIYIIIVWISICIYEAQISSQEGTKSLSSRDRWYLCLDSPELIPNKCRLQVLEACRWIRVCGTCGQLNSCLTLL